MIRKLPLERPGSVVRARTARGASRHGRALAVVGDGDTTTDALSVADMSARLSEAEDTLRAIAAGEVDAFVVAEGDDDRRVFTLSTADRPYRMFVENMRDGAITVSAKGLILYANRRFADLLARSRETIVGAHLDDFLDDDPTNGVAAIDLTGTLSATIESRLVTTHGVVVPVLVGIAPLDVDGDQLTCLTFADLTPQKLLDREIARLSSEQADRMADLQHAQAALTMQATHDALTGLPNRALLIDRIEQALRRSQRSGLSTAVFFVDLDRFKRVNDTGGHAAGDEVLRRAADQLVSCMRPGDTVSRIGGDEFVVLASDVDDTLHAVDIGTRLAEELGRRVHDNVPGGRVTASIGISVSADGRATAETLLQEADKAMYRAKAFGGDRAEVFDLELGLQISERTNAQRHLQSALDGERVVTFYQPIIDLQSGYVIGFEALARINEPDGSITHPARFIAVAEESGLVVPLGTQVISMACDDAMCWEADLKEVRPISVAVNLSARQFERGDLATVIIDELARSGLAPERLHLELTETAVLELRPHLLEQLRKIRDLGVQIGLDDFGTGYASLTHLRRLPLSFVKIDQTFVQGIGQDESDEQIVAAVVDLAANLHLRSIAEGVETQEQLSRLRTLGCDQAQGYLFARPVAQDETSRVLQHSAW